MIEVEVRRRARAFVAACAVVVCACKSEPPRPPPTQTPEAKPATSVEAPPAKTEPIKTAATRANLPGLIAFVRETDTGRREAWITEPNGQNARKLAAPADMDAYPSAASADGRFLVGVAAKGEEPFHEEQLIVWDLREGSHRLLRPVSARTRHPSFSPDGKAIVFESGAHSFADVYRIDVDGEKLQRLTENKEGNFEPSWSADGKHILFTSSRDGDPEVYRMDARGENEERLTAFHMEDLNAVTAPAGGNVAFITNREGEDAVFVMALDGTGQRRVVPANNDDTAPQESELAWSKDGKRLAFVQKHGEKTRLMMADLARKTSKPVTDGTSLDEMPRWSPDGQHLVFVSDRRGSPSLFILDANGSTPTPVFQTPTPGTSDWLPVWLPRAAAVASD